jgi:hypothetical protein
LILLGPLVLLRHPRFNDVLDGTTFGATAAIAFTGVEVLVQAFSFLGEGLSPNGVVLPWIVRLTTISIALPVLWAAAAGAVCGAFWLRYRAPVRDRRALGLLSNPAAALVLGSCLVVAGSVTQPLLQRGWYLALLIALDVLALLWLRRVIHVGLLEEAAEINVGPEITCANCGKRTAVHTFCSSCGIALRALPKGATTGLPVSPAPVRARA